MEQDTNTTHIHMTPTRVKMCVCIYIYCIYSKHGSMACATDIWDIAMVGNPTFLFKLCLPWTDIQTWKTGLIVVTTNYKRHIDLKHGLRFNVQHCYLHRTGGRFLAAALTVQAEPASTERRGPTWTHTSLPKLMQNRFGYFKRHLCVCVSLVSKGWG